MLDVYKNHPGLEKKRENIKFDLVGELQPVQSQYIQISWTDQKPIFSEAVILKRIGANHLILQPKFPVFPGEC